MKVLVKWWSPKTDNKLWLEPELERERPTYEKKPPREGQSKDLQNNTKWSVFGSVSCSIRVRYEERRVLFIGESS